MYERKELLDNYIEECPMSFYGIIGFTNDPPIESVFSKVINKDMMINECLLDVLDRKIFNESEIEFIKILEEVEIEIIIKNKNEVNNENDPQNSFFPSS